MFSRVPSWFHGGLTLTVGAILSAGVLPFIFVSLLFAPFISSLPLLGVALWLTLLGFSGVLLIVVTVFVFPTSIPVSSRTDTSIPPVIRDLPQDVQKRILDETSTNQFPTTVMYSATLALRGLNLLVGAYAAALAYIAFGVAGLAVATIISGFLAARRHLEIQAVPETQSPMTNGRIPRIVETVADDLGIEPPAVYRASGRGIGAVNRNSRDSYLLADPKQFEEYTDEELQALIAHELAHTDQPFPVTVPIQLRPMPFVITLVIAALLTPAPILVGILLSVLTVSTHLYIVHRRRRLEVEADRVAAEYGGAIPTAVVLVRESTMAPLNTAHTPILQAAELLSTHPRTVNRLQTIFDTTDLSQSKMMVPYEDSPFDAVEWQWPDE